MTRKKLAQREEGEGIKEVEAVKEKGRSSVEMRIDEGVWHRNGESREKGSQKKEGGASPSPSALEDVR